MNRRLDQLEKKFDQQTGGDSCRHAGDVQVIEKDENGEWEHKVKAPEPCEECGLYSPINLRVILEPEKVKGEQ